MFHSARIKLTAWYLLIIMAVSITFSIAIYRMLTAEVERFERLQRLRIERRMQGLFIPPDFNPPEQLPTANPELIAETDHRILLMLLLVNVGVFVLAGGLGYVLAGRTLKPIHDMVDEQNRFVSDASHELRTPLTALKTTMEVSLRDKNLTLTDAKALIKTNIEDVDKLQSLSDALLQLTQYQKPNGHMKFEPISLTEVLKESVRKVAPMAKQKAIVIATSIPNQVVEGNAVSLCDLFVILLDNAVKYSPKNTTVSVSSKKSDGSIIVTVKDQGIGIDKNDIPHIFDRFYRADSSRAKTSSDGYGLGLSIAKSIVLMHSGTIDMQSQLEKGTTFTIKLPVKHGSRNLPYSRYL